MYNGATFESKLHFLGEHKMNKTFGERIAEKRKSKGYTQEQLAEMMGVTAQAVSKWENDLSCPDVMTLPTLAQKLGCTVDELLTGRDSAPQPTVVPAEHRKPFEQMMLKIIVNSNEGDRVFVNIPMPLLKIFLDAGLNPFSLSMGKSDSLNNLNIDWNAIIMLIEQGTIGKLVEVSSADGDVVEIVVE